MDIIKGIALTENGFKILKDNNLLHARMERLLFSGIGGLIGHPQEGSFIPQMLWDQEDEETAFDIINEAEELISNDMPEIFVTKMGIESVPLNDGGANLTILRINTEKIDSENEELELEFFKIREKN